jgi:hypothetical protein
LKKKSVWGFAKDKEDCRNGDMPLVGRKSCGRVIDEQSVTLVREGTTVKRVIDVARKYGSRAVIKQRATTTIGHRAFAFVVDGRLW